MFRTLCAHFARRLIRSGGEDASDLDMSLGVSLALLASPGVLLALGLMNKYSSLLRYVRGVPIVEDPYPRAVGDGYSLLVFSMAITGFVTLWKWDRILPDPIDHLNLAPLPIPPHRLFLASLTAVLLVTVVFILDVNAGSLFVFPMVVTADQGSVVPFLRLTAAHLVVLLLGSAFTFCACFGLMGLLVLLAPAVWFTRLSIAVRAGAGALLLLLWIYSKDGHAWLRFPRDGTAAWQQWIPSVWFASLYGPLIGRPDLGVEILWQRGLWALALAAFCTFGSYSLGYRRGMSGGLLRSAHRRRWPQWLLRQGGNSLERAAFRFTMLTLWRSERHSMLILTIPGAGLVVGVTHGDLSQLPFYVAFSLIAAIRVALQVPASAPANWPFRLLAVAVRNEPVRVARRILWIHCGLFAALPTLMLCRWADSFTLILLSLLLIEGLLLNFRQIPCTVRPAGFRNTRLVYALFGLLGLAIFPAVGAHIASRIAVQPLRALIPLAFAAILLHYRERAVEAFASGMPPLVFDDTADDVIRLRL